MLPANGLLRTIRRPRPSRHPPRPTRHCGGPSARRPRARRRATPCRSASRTGSQELPSLSHVAPSGVAEPVLRLLGSHQSPCPFPRRCAAPEPRPLPSTGVARLQRYCGPLRHPERPDLSLAGCRLARATPPPGFPVLRPFPSSMRAVANTPAEPVGASVARFPTAGSLPRVAGGSASASQVSRPARRSLTLRPAWSLSHPRRPLVIGVLQAMSLPPSSAPTATGWSDSCRAGFAPAEERRLFTAHRHGLLGPAFPRRGRLRARSSARPRKTEVAGAGVSGHRTPQLSLGRPAAG